VYRLKSAHRLKPALTPAIAGLLESATSWPWSHICLLSL
jgi:hypothetical protein